MTIKLTLTIEDGVIHSAKKYARNKGESLSHIVENYLKSITATENAHAAISPEVAAMMGTIKLPEDFDYKKELGNALTKKYR